MYCTFVTLHHVSVPPLERPGVVYILYNVLINNINK